MNASAPAPDSGRAGERDFYLPDFCESRAVLAIVLIATLLGLVLAVARQSTFDGFWFELARTSAFLLWAGLLCATVLCRSRSWLARLPLRAGVAWSLALMVGTVGVLSEVVYQLGRHWTAQLGTLGALLPDSHWRFVLPNLLIAAVVSALALRYFYVAHQWRRSVELEARARIHALQARIRPHFLFNSMNTIASLTRSNPLQAEEAIEDLADLFRASLSDARAQITLDEEIEVARTYQRIEQLRLGDRLRVRWDLAGLPTGCVVPSLLLQPLLENAIGHGIEALPEGGAVDVRGHLEAGLIVLEVANPRPTAQAVPRRGNQMALDNIRQRLELVFPGRSAVEVEDTDGRYTVRLRFPAVEDTAGRSSAGRDDGAALRS